MGVHLEAEDVISDAKVIPFRLAGLTWLPAAAALAFLIPIVLLYWQVGGPSGLLADPSTGVHIRVGQWILAHHAVPGHDLFSFTMPGKSWCDWEWLSEIVFALAYRLHGLSGVAALSVALLCLTSVAIYKTARVHAGPIVAGAACALVMGFARITELRKLMSMLSPNIARVFIKTSLCGGGKTGAPPGVHKMAESTVFA